MASGKTGKKMKAQTMIRILKLFGTYSRSFSLIKIFFFSIHPFFRFLRFSLWIVWVFLFFSLCLSLSLPRRAWVCTTLPLCLSLSSLRSINRQAWSFGGGALWRGVLLSTDWLKSDIMKGKSLPEPPLVELFFPHPFCSSNYAFAFTDIS